MAETDKPGLDAAKEGSPAPVGRQLPLLPVVSESDLKEAPPDAGVPRRFQGSGDLKSS